MAKTISISEIMEELNCKIDRARDIMLLELPHMDISSPGSRKPTWRAKRTDFDRWVRDREKAAGNDRLKPFAERYVR